MFVACKFHELYPPVITDFGMVTKNSFTSQQILSFEVKLMQELDFELNATIPAYLLESYSLAVGCYKDKEVLYNACYLIDVSLLSAEFLKFSASLIVICAMTLSFKRYIAAGDNLDRD